MDSYSVRLFSNVPSKKTRNIFRKRKKIEVYKWKALDFGCVFNLNWLGFEFDKTNVFSSATKGTLELFIICNETTVKKL